jgi:serine/threonine-protein kinase
MVVEEPPQAPHLLNPRVDRTLEAICLKCLEKDARDRYRSAEALAEELAAYQRGEPIQADRGMARSLFGAVLRETRYTEVMTLWSGVLMGLAISYFFICLAKSFLFWFALHTHASLLVLWVGYFLFNLGLVWFCRLRAGPPLSYVERQMAQIWGFFSVGFFVTVWQYWLIDAPVTGLPPILILELAVAAGCMAALLGGSFYVVTAACLATSILEALWPRVGPIISGVFCSPALFWLGWKYARRR